MGDGQVRLLKGTLDMLVLQILLQGRQHGFAIARQIEELTDDTLRVEEGSLYPALYRMERRGWIAADWGTTENNRRARYYGLTPAGRRQLETRHGDWERFVGAVEKIMGAAPGRSR